MSLTRGREGVGIVEFLSEKRDLRAKPGKGESKNCQKGTMEVCGRSYCSSRRSSARFRFVAHAIVRAWFNCLASSFA